MHTGVLVSTQLCKGGGVDVGNQVAMHTYTDACTHSKQGLGLKEE